jgi:hypothetical protein
MLFDNYINNIYNIFSRLEKDIEFEIMFNNYKNDNKLSMNNFIHVLNFIGHRAKTNDMKLEEKTILDISYNIDNLINHRISINGLDNINKILNLIHQRKNNIIFSLLITQFNKDKNIDYITKFKKLKDIYDMDEYDIRVRMSHEKKMDNETFTKLSNIQVNEVSKIIYRYKQRITLTIFDNDDGKLKLDLTIIKSSNTPQDLHIVPEDYEIELEYEIGKNKLDEKLLKKILNEAEIIKQVLEKCEVIINKNESNNIINSYKKLVFGIEHNQYTNLYSMQPISVEVQHVVDKIPNKYSVTDKADGQKYQLYIENKNIYLISNNLVVKKTKYEYKKYKDVSVFEGELIHIKNNNCYLFMIFDCLFFDGKDIRNEVLLKNRLKYINEFLNNMDIKYYDVKEYSKDFNIEKQEEYYIEEINKYYNNLNNIIKKSDDNDIIFHPKIFLFPTGGDNSEVYSFSNILWTLCTDNNKNLCPYLLDGIIYTGIEQKYTKDKRDHKYPIYKYKPPSTNSIDVYITFQKNIENGGYLDIYDNSINGVNINKIFRVVNFYVGDTIDNKEIPIPFLREENNHEAYLPLERDHIRDMEGNLVNDNTVVEIIYNNDPSIPHQYRWSILRTRWDKSESIIKYNKQYGNYKDVAIKIWKSMIEAVTIDEIKKLSRPDTYNSQMKILSSRIDTKVISSERAQDIYYQKITNLGKIFKSYHNWIKSIIIYVYCMQHNKDKYSDKLIKNRVLDLGFGRGGDLMKYYTTRVQEIVGIDPDYEGLFGAIDSAFIRYKQNVSKFPDFPNTVMIHADASLPFESDIQEKKFGNMRPDNKSLIDKYLNKNSLYDIINCQFALHYLFGTEYSVNNFTNIIKYNLKKDGYFICTLFDPYQVSKILNKNDVFTSYYTDDEGQKTKFFEIIKKFNGEIKDEPGQLIDVHMSWISEPGKYLSEYFVTEKFLVKNMEKAGCVLYDTDYFHNIYNINKEWFLNVINHEENVKNKKFYMESRKFYEELKGADKESLIWNELFRFYIFKKIN